VERIRRLPPLVVAVLAWFVATAVVAGVYAIWSAMAGDRFSWFTVRDAALMAAPMAILLLWRDRRR
jgi:hypothetical protein